MGEEVAELVTSCNPFLGALGADLPEGRSMDGGIIGPTA
jgi:hypothetical protein